MLGHLQRRGTPRCGHSVGARSALCSLGRTEASRSKPRYIPTHSPPTPNSNHGAVAACELPGFEPSYRGVLARLVGGSARVLHAAQRSVGARPEQDASWRSQMRNTYLQHRH